MYTTTSNVPIEIPIRILITDGRDPFRDLDVDVDFVGPDGRVRRVPAFWAGDESFKVRFAASTPGRYRYTVRVSPSDGANLATQTGEVQVVPYEGSNPLYAHGRIRVADTKGYFEHTDGTPFLWLGDTQWQAFTSRLDWPHGFAHLEDDRVAKGYSVVQVVAGPLSCFDVDEAWHPHQSNAAGWPWEQDWARVNPAYYDIVDLKIAGLVDRGLMPCIVGMWAYYINSMGPERVRKHWRYLVARYAALPVVWCLAGEVGMPVYRVGRAGGQARDDQLADQLTGWTDMARALREVDPFENLITMHPNGASEVGMSGRTSLAADDVLDFDLLQTGHYGFQHLEPTVKAVRAAVARQPLMPVVQGEVNYEGIFGSCWQEMQRFQFWTAMVDGAAGYTYGAAGLWVFWSRDTYSKGGDSEFVEDAGGGPWQDVMHLPGSEQVGIGKRLLERYPWWRFSPIVEPSVAKLGRTSSFATGIPGTIAIYYVPSGLEVESLHGILKAGEQKYFWWRLCLPIQVDPTGRFEASWLDPRTGEETAIGRVTPDAAGTWTPPAKPSLLDWVLLIVDHDRLSRVTSEAHR